VPKSFRIARIAGASLLAALVFAGWAVSSPPPWSGGQNDVDHDMVIESLDYYRHGDCKKAEPLFEKILLRQPKDIATRKLLGNCYLQDKKMDDARAQFQIVLDTAPQDVEAFEGLKASMTEIQKRTLLKQSLAIQSRQVTAEEFRASHEFTDAENLIRAHRYDEAEKILDNLVSRHPDSVPVRERLAEIYTTTKRFDQAAEIYQSLSEEKRASPRFLLRLAQNQESANHLPQATKSYRLYLEKKPDDGAAQLTLARILMQQGEYPEAAKNYRDYLAKNPKDSDARMALANMFLWSGRYAEAVPEFERLQAERPKDIHVGLSLAQCYQQLGDKEKALKAYQEVVALDPGNPAAVKERDQYIKYFDELPRQEAYAALEKKDYDSAIKHFNEYSEKHPNDAQVILEMARVCSWDKRFSESIGYYEKYLQRAPQDYAVLRELAQMELWNKRYPEARKNYEVLTRSSSATPEDYEALLETYTWSGDMAGAQPVASKLAQIQPTNELALQTLRTYAEQRRLAARNHAEELAAARRYPEAVEAYRSYMDVYGKDPQTELLICRLYSWAKDYSASANEYRTYISQHPQDTQARLELANVESWGGQYGPAETDYQAVLQVNPHDVDALVGAAQVLDYQQKDPFAVRDGYLRVLKTDPKNSLAEKRIAELHPYLAPQLSFNSKDFSDSDGVFWTANTTELTIPTRGRLKITPFYTTGYFKQNVADLRLGAFGNGGGGRIEMIRNTGVSLMGELGGMYWSEREGLGNSIYRTGRTSVNARAEASFRPDRHGIMGFTYIHRDAIYDLTTVQVLAAGIMVDSVFVSYQRPVSERLHLYTTGGFSHYSSGTLPSLLGNTQPRFSARMDFQARPWMTLGYAGRVSGFTSASPIYFSPTLYQTHGLTYTLSKTVTKNLYLAASGEVDYGRIGTHQMAVPIGVSATVTGESVNTIELAVVPRLRWRMGHGITLQMDYRFSQGKGGSALNLPGTLYRTQGGELSLVKVF
jgi:tetratricopeptide (TPR) repeat protein